jgi:hypothetical protein
MKDSNQGMVYIITNPAMPGLVKIGITQDLQTRLNSLFDSSVPFPFDCVYACEVKDYLKVEKAIHKICDSHRVNQKREFFNIDPELVIPTLELLSIKDITETVEQELNEGLEPEEKKYVEVSAKKDIPVSYKTYNELKNLLIDKEGFRAGYFTIRVAANHKRKNAPYYKYNGENYYDPDIFIDQAKSENIYKEAE